MLRAGQNAGQMKLLLDLAGYKVMDLWWLVVTPQVLKAKQCFEKSNGSSVTFVNGNQPRMRQISGIRPTV